MKQQGTDYRIAESGADYSKCHSFIRDNHFQDPPITFPTIMAERKGKLVGVLGTHKSNKAIIAGPLIINTPGNNAFVGVRLIEGYEKVLATLKVKTYVAAMWKHQPDWIRMASAVGFEPLAVENGVVWMKRTLSHA